MDWSDLLRVRESPPSDYLFQIENFSLLKNAPIESFTSDDFRAGGYIWRLVVFYPNEYNGRKKYISVYLEIRNSSLRTGWEVKVKSSFFIFDHIRNIYLSKEAENETRYSALNKTIGIGTFMTLDTFSNPKNGYLYDDSCAFGVDISVIKRTAKMGRLSMIYEPTTCYYSWKVSKFSSSASKIRLSKPFGQNKWYIALHPNGVLEGEDNSISLYLGLSKTSIKKSRLFAKFILRVKNQINEEHFEEDESTLFTPSCCEFGWKSFMSLAKLKDSEQGFLVNDTLIVEAEVTVIGMVLQK